MTLLIIVLLVVGAAAFAFRIFWPQPQPRPDLIALGLFCWLVAYALGHVTL